MVQLSKKEVNYLRKRKCWVLPEFDLKWALQEKLKEIPKTKNLFDDPNLTNLRGLQGEKPSISGTRYVQSDDPNMTFMWAQKLKDINVAAKNLEKDIANKFGWREEPLYETIKKLYKEGEPTLFEKIRIEFNKYLRYFLNE